MPVEVGGTTSTFGSQALSTKPTEPRTKFGTSGRVENLAEKPFEDRRLGGTSFTCGGKATSGFGAQASSKSFTAPGYKIGQRFPGDHDTSTAAKLPGPGSYTPGQDAVGRQMLSNWSTAPATRIGTADRFGRIREDSITTLGGAARFHGHSKRHDLAFGSPGLKPTVVDDPGPGTYEAHSSMGQQVVSPKKTAPRLRLGTSDRERQRKVFVSREHEREALGSQSPSPLIYNPRLAASSKVKATSSWKFGSGDRFSQVKPATPDREKKLMALSPGPGSYIV